MAARYEDLPELLPGKVWAYVFYPGGRKELRQVSPEVVVGANDAVVALRANQKAIVAFDDGRYVWDEWQRWR